MIVSYGLTGRSAKGAVMQLREAGEKVGYIRPITLWPYPEKAFEKINKQAIKGIITVEANATGQMIDDAALSVKKAIKDRNIPAYALPYVYGVPAIKKIVADYYEIKNGNKKEVY